MATSKLLMMQGRIVDSPNNGDLDWFPIHEWVHEFSLSKTLDISSIELVFDKKNLISNPLRSKLGRARLRSEFQKSRLAPYSCCLNFIIENSIQDEVVLNWCVESLHALGDVGVKYAILPLFEKSDLRDLNLEHTIIKLAEVANNNNIKILIESNERAHSVLNFLDRIPSSNVGIVYDLGNASFCGYDIEKELCLIRHKIAHIHIKDKSVSGSNVPLGSGIVEFSSIFRVLLEIKYQGMFTLETCKGENGLASAKENIKFIRGKMILSGFEPDY